MKTLIQELTANNHSVNAVDFTDAIDTRVLAANTEEIHAVPTGARVVMFSANNDFYARPDATASVPAADITDGTGSELNPTVRAVRTVTNLHLIAPNADTVVTMSFYS